MIISNRILMIHMTEAIILYFCFAFEQQFPYLNIAVVQKGKWRSPAVLLLYKSIARTALLTYLEMLLIIDLRNNRTIILNRMLKLIIATHFQHYYSSLNYYWFLENLLPECLFPQNFYLDLQSSSTIWVDSASLRFLAELHLG